MASLFVSLGRKRLKLDPKYKPLYIYYMYIGMNCMCIYIYIYIYIYTRLQKRCNFKISMIYICLLFSHQKGETGGMSISR